MTAQAPAGKHRSRWSGSGAGGAGKPLLTRVLSFSKAQTLHELSHVPPKKNGLQKLPKELNAEGLGCEGVQVAPSGVVTRAPDA
jgi:hypothetical protein